ncbi:MAG: hypothetical protein GY696_21780, partial [Gammaproteobacteria bacterium]|nr:hypothetical protein [Gammaproteobacteria bacterium]
LKVWLPLRIEFEGRRTFIPFVIDEDPACDCDCVLGSLGMKLLGFKILTASGDVDLLSSNQADMEGESSRVFRVALSGPKTLPGLDPKLIKVEATTPIPAPVCNSVILVYFSPEECGHRVYSISSAFMEVQSDTVEFGHKSFSNVDKRTKVTFPALSLSFPAGSPGLAGEGGGAGGSQPHVQPARAFQVFFRVHLRQKWNSNVIPCNLGYVQSHFGVSEGGFRVSATTVFPG